jgi:Flp pilus assembly protein TadG
VIGLLRDRKRSREQGSAAVEFALVLPLVLILALALLQVGLLVNDRLIVQGAARAGAREGAVTTDDAAVRQAALDATGSLDQSRIDVSILRSEGAGAPVTVRVTYHAAVSIPLVDWLFRSAIDLSESATMRQEAT